MIISALYVLMLLGALGGLDTLYYHEWKLRLPSRPGAGLELRLHAWRDFAYTLVFGSLAWTTWNGLWVWPLALVLGYEVVVTLKDFIEEDQTRRLPAGERIMHAVMGIVYGVFLTLLYPHAVVWARMPSRFDTANYGLVSWVLTAFAAGVFASGVRDLVASRKLIREAGC